MQSVRWPRRCCLRAWRPCLRRGRASETATVTRRRGRLARCDLRMRFAADVPRRSCWQDKGDRLPSAIRLPRRTASSREAYGPRGQVQKRTKPAVGTTVPPPGEEYCRYSGRGRGSRIGATTLRPRSGTSSPSTERRRWVAAPISAGAWLRRDLAKNRSRCTLAYFHHPLRASGRDYDSPEVRPFWTILHNRNADVILSAHAHRYERYAPMTPRGKRSARGIRQFIVGTGGAPGGAQKGPKDPECGQDNNTRAAELRIGPLLPRKCPRSLQDLHYSARTVPLSHLPGLIHRSS